MISKYEKLFDDEVKEFIRISEFFAGKSASDSVEKMRKTWLSYMPHKTCFNRLCLKMCLLYLKFGVMDARESS